MLFCFAFCDFSGGRELSCGIVHQQETHSFPCVAVSDSLHAEMSRATGKVYVGELGDHANKADLEDLFEKFGKIREIWIARNPPGFAFVFYEDPRDAEEAVRDLDGSSCGGRRIKCEHAKARDPGHGGRGGGGGGGGGGGNFRRDDRQGGGGYGGGGGGGGYGGSDRGGGRRGGGYDDEYRRRSPSPRRRRSRSPVGRRSGGGYRSPSPNRGRY